MPKTHLRRTVAAVATALACLLPAGIPAAAIPTTYTATLALGNITITKTGITPEVINLGSTTSCAPGGTINANFTSNTTSSNVSVTAFNWSHVVNYANGGGYLTVITRAAFGNVGGHLDSSVTPHTITGSRIGLNITIYNTFSCTPMGDPVCNLGLVLAWANATTTSVSTSNTYSFGGSSVGNIAANPSCSAGPSFLVGAVVTVTSPLGGHFTGTI